jgi:hypothetical protein
VIITGDTSGGSRNTIVSPSYVSPVAPQPTQQMGSMPTTTISQSDRPSSASAIIPVAPSTGGDIVQGFASQIPLALALRQVLPVGYNFSIDQNVDMNTSVSYKGGKSWRETIHDMLASAGLTSREQGTTVSVSRAGLSELAPLAIDNSPMPGQSVGFQEPPSMGHLPNMMASIRSDVPSYNVNPADGWTAEHGDTLHKVLSEWCRRANVELQWLAEYDYPVEASAHFSGSFEDAVRNLLAGFETARPQPIGELHSNPSAGQMVLVVSPRGNSYSN